MEKILSINSGSSSLKISLFSMPAETCLARILIDYSNPVSTNMIISLPGSEPIPYKYTMKSTPVALAISLLKKYNVIKNPKEIVGIGHRIVAGGEIFKKSITLTPDMLIQLQSIHDLAPLHNPANIAGIQDAMNLLPDCPQVAVFDTSFFSDLPPENYLYALPLDYYRAYHIRKYGAHGTSHRFVAQQAASLLGHSLSSLKLITLHLGSGASIAAIRYGKSIDISMGFSPLTGLLMGTRCGDIDPSALAFLIKHQAFSSIDDCMETLNKKSGLLGISGISSDIRKIEAHIEDNHQAKLAINMFVKKICDYLGAYWLELEGADALVFTGGIGENDCYIRKLICQKLTCLGIGINSANNKNQEAPFDFANYNSKARLLVIPTNEELMIARDTYELIRRKEDVMDTV